MNKILLAAIMLLPFCGYGRSLTPDEALGRVMAETGTLRNSTAGKFQAADLVYTGKSADAVSPLYYIFSATGKGFMIAGADDVAAPVLGYGDSGFENYESLPCNVKWWLGEYAAQIEAARKAEGKPEEGRVARAIDKSKRHDVGLMCTTRWNQDAPYNNLTPRVNGTATYTGCVATAMAQVMKYQNHPPKGTGSKTYTWNNQQLSLDFSTITFDWDNMLNDYAVESCNDAQADAVANLMKACGYSVEMSYGTGASGAFTQAVGQALYTYFDYSKNLHVYTRSVTPRDEWDELVYQSLANGAPVVYAGNNDGGGHAFVCDGYHNATGYFHFNWGWGGTSDGYFRLDALDPGSQGIGGSSAGYNNDQCVIVNALPSSKSPGSSLRYALGTGSNLTYTISGTTVQMTSEVNNTGDGDINNGRSCLRAKNIETSNYSNGYTSSTSLPFGRYYPNLSLSMSMASLPDGTYEVQPWLQCNGVWTPFDSDVSISNKVLITKSGSTLTMENVEGAKWFDVSDLDVVSGNNIYAGLPFKVTVTFTNNSDYESTQKISMGVVETNGSNFYGADAFSYINLVGHENRTMEFVITAPSTTGSYYLWPIIEESDGYYLMGDEHKVITVKASPGDATLTCHHFSIDNSTQVNASEMKFNAGLACTEGYHATPLRVFLFENGQTTSSNYVISPHVFMEAGDSKMVNFTGVTERVKPDTEYRAILCYQKNPSDGLNQIASTRFKVVTLGAEQVFLDMGSAVLESNPVDNEAVVKAGSSIKDVQVYAVSGSLVSAKADIVETEARINVSSLIPGIYLVKVLTDEGMSTLRMVKR